MNISEKIDAFFENRKLMKNVVGGCFAALAVIALILLIMHFSAAGLFFFIGAALMAAGMFVPNMMIATMAGFAVSALAAFIEFIWYITRLARAEFYPFYLLFPILGCILMIAVFAVMAAACINTKMAKWFGIGAAAASFALMMIIVGAGFSRYFMMNYLTYVQKMIMIPAFLLFGLMMTGEEPVFKLQKPAPRPQPAFNAQNGPYVPNRQYVPNTVGQVQPRRVQADPVQEQITRLQKLKEMADQGIITEEEFQAKKAEILNSGKSGEPEEPGNTNT